MILTFMGIDGSGKSTLTRFLRDEFNSRGKKAEVVWATLRPVLLRPFIIVAKKMMVGKHDKFDNYDKHISAKRAGMKKMSWTHGIYFMVMLIDYLPQVFWKVVVKRMLGHIVLCDRYYHDLLIDYGITVNMTPEKVVELIQKVEWLFLRPSKLFFLSVRPEVAMSRKTDVPAEAYLVERDRYYKVVAKAKQAIVLDGEDSIESLQQNVLKLI